MAHVTLLQNSWTGGELSPYLAGRIDSAPYKMGARTLENFIPMRQGPLRRRPGTYHAGTTRKPSSAYLKARLVEFVDTAGVSWVLEFTDLKCRIYSTSTPAIVGGPTELVTTIAEAELFEMRYVINAGALWIAHKSHKVQKIDYTVATTTWAISEPAFTGITFSVAGDYPAVIGFHAGRLVLGATTNFPTNIWLSMAYDSSGGTSRYTNFTVGSTWDSAISIQESDMGGTTLRWVASARKFIAGTNRRTWAETANSTASGATGTDFDLDIIGYTGSADVQGAQTENILAYIAANGQALRAMLFSTEGGGFQDFELTQACEHVLKPGVIDLRVQTDPDPIIWLVRSDGVLVSILIDTQNNTIAASRHTLGGSGLVESVAVAHTGAGDEIWLSVLRGTTRTVEYMKLHQDEDTSSIHYVDDGLHLTPASATVTGLSHLEGKVVAAVGDGAVLPEKTVASGQVVYSRSIDDIHIGYPFDSTLLMVRPEVPAQGTSQGKKKRVEEITLRLLNSAGGSTGQELTNLRDIIYLVAGSYLYGSAPGLFTGDIKLDFSGTVDEDADVYIVQRAPMPFTILAAMTKIALMEA
jgi:hypothetical protein